MDPEYEELIAAPRRAKVLQEMTPRLRDFIAEHDLPLAKPVVYRPLAFCEPKRCFVNVDQQVSKRGGSALAGWLFWEIQNTVLQTEAHCIWASEQGAWIDITPQQVAPRRPLFSPDPRVAKKRGYTAGYETPLTTNPKVLALQRFTKAIARIREEHMQGFGKEMFIPVQQIWDAATDAQLPADVAGFLFQKYLSWERTMEQKYSK